MKQFIAIATMVGMIVGAGVLGIPYVLSQSGIIPGILLILGVGVALLFVNLYYGEVVLRTKGNHQLPGYAGKYLGKWGKRALFIILSLGMYGGLTAYLLGEGMVLSSMFGGDPRLWSFAFFIITGLLIFHGLRTVGKAELALTATLTTILIIVSLGLIPKIHLDNYVSSSPSLFAAYGVILFALSGLTSIPLLKEELGRERKKLRSVIIWGSILPVILYILFAGVVVGVVGAEQFSLFSPDERIASVALQLIVDGPIGLLLNVFAVLAMGTSYLASGIVMKELYAYDVKLGHHLGFFLTLGIPFLVFLIDGFVRDIANFVSVLGWTGSVAGGLMGISLVLMFHKAKKKGKRKPEYSLPEIKAVSIILVLIFVLGILYQLLP